MITLKKQKNIPAVFSSYDLEGTGLFMPEEATLVFYDTFAKCWRLSTKSNTFLLSAEITPKEAGRILTSCKLIGLDGKVHKPRHRNKTLLDKALKLLGEPT